MVWLNFFIYFPTFASTNWKITKVIKLHKAGKPVDLVRRYRPLSLISSLGKPLEKAVADNLSNWTKSNKKFNKQQNGFRKNSSTNDNLLNLIKANKVGFYKGHLSSGIFLDVKKAFEQFWYDGLLFKLVQWV